MDSSKDHDADLYRERRMTPRRRVLNQTIRSFSGAPDIAYKVTKTVEDALVKTGYLFRSDN